METAAEASAPSLPVAGQEALDLIMQTWTPLWVDAERACEPRPASWELSRPSTGDAEAGGSACPRGVHPRPE
eukprot:4740544-Pyramimonas_sp.AAC.1